MSETPPRSSAAPVLFSPRTAIGLVLAGVFAFAAYMVLSTYAPDLQSGDDGRAHALSKSAIGYFGLTVLLHDLGRPTAIVRARPRGQTPDLTLFTPDLDVDREAFLAQQTPGDSLVVAPKWLALGDPLHAGWVANPQTLPVQTYANFFKGVGIPNAKLARRPGRGPVRLVGAPGERAEGLNLEIGPVSELQTLQGGGLTPVIVDQDGGVILAHRPATGSYFLADPDLLNTQGLKDLRTARGAVAIVDLFAPPGKVVVVNVALNGFAISRNVLKLAFQPPFLGATLCLVGAALMIGLRAAARFGAVRRGGRALALGKTGLVDNTAGLIRMAHREPRMAQPYAELQRQAVLRALGSPRLTDGAPGFLEQQSRRFGASALPSDLEAETFRVASPAALLNVARKWRAWRSEMTRDRR